MPTKISQLINAFDLSIVSSIKWGTKINEERSGIYIVSNNSSIDYIHQGEKPIVFNESKIDEWLANAPNILLHNDKVTRKELMLHLTGFWLADESILYIGKAEKQSLANRVTQFYNHKVGKRSPHKGGYWLKLLSNIDELYIHLIPTNHSHEIEEKMLSYFLQNVSAKSKVKLTDSNLCLPFANLQLRSGNRKAHGLTKHYE